MNIMKIFLHWSISGQLVDTQGRLHERFLTHKILIEPALYLVEQLDIRFIAFHIIISWEIWLKTLHKSSRIHETSFHWICDEFSGDYVHERNQNLIQTPVGSQHTLTGGLWSMIWQVVNKKPLAKSLTTDLHDLTSCLVHCVSMSKYLISGGIAIFK